MSWGLWLIIAALAGLGVIVVHHLDNVPNGVLGFCLGVAMVAAYNAGESK